MNENAFYNISKKVLCGNFLWGDPGRDCTSYF